MTAQAAQTSITTAQALLTTLQQKYGALPSAGDYRQRVLTLVQEGATAQKPQWERDAAAARAAQQQQLHSNSDSSNSSNSRRRHRRRSQTPTQTQVQTQFPSGPVTQTQPGGTSTVQPTGQRTGGGQRQQDARAARWQSPAAAPCDHGLHTATRTGDWRRRAVEGRDRGAARGRGGRRLRPARAKSPRSAAVLRASHHNGREGVRATVRVVVCRGSCRRCGAGARRGSSLKEQIFFEQREKYQARYNDAQDEVTAASMALTQQAPLLATAHQNLLLLADTLYDRVRALMIARYGGAMKTLRNAALLMPIWRLFRRSGLLLKIVIGIFVYYLATYVIAGVVRGEVGTAIIVYGVYVAVAFSSSGTWC
jgi:hypothetical protein